MKILHVATGFPLSYQGGITNYVRALAEKQQAQGHDVSVFGDPDSEVFTYRYIARESQLAPFYMGKLEDPKGLEMFRKLLDEEKYDIIHLHMVYGLDWDIGEVLKPWRYVVSLHDYNLVCPRIQMLDTNKQLCKAYDEDRCSKCISYLEHIRICRGVLRVARKVTGNKELPMPIVKQKFTAQRHEKFAELLQNAALILPVSKRVGEIFQQSGFDGNYKVMHIGNNSAEHFVESYNVDLSDRKIQCAVLGSMTYSKGADLLIEVAQRLTPEKFEIHFWGRPFEYKEQLEHAGVICHGAYKQDNLPNLLKDMDIGFVLSIWEDNGPQVVMEMLNNRIPVMGTKMGGIVDFVNFENGYVFDPYSVEEKDTFISFLNNLTLEKVYEMKLCIRPTTTPMEHYNELMSAYAALINS